MPTSDTADPGQAPPPPTILPLADPACVGARATVPALPEVPAAPGDDQDADAG